MAFGARPIGTRTLGDSAPVDSFVTVEGDEIFAAVEFEVSGDLSVATTTFAALALSGSVEIDTSLVRVVEWSRIKFNANGRFKVTLPPIGTDRRVILTDVDGTPIVEYDNADIGKLTFELNQPDEWEFTVPATDPKLSNIVDGFVKEAQLWRGDQLLTWGPVTQPQMNKDVAKIKGSGALWHLTRRHVGKANRTNYVTNGDFEDGLSGWTIGVLEANEPHRSPSNWSASIKTNRQVTGDRSLYLRQVSSTQPKYGFCASQFFEWDVPAENLDGDRWTLVAYAWVDSAQWRNALPGRDGMWLQRVSTVDFVSIAPEGGGTATVYPVTIEKGIASIDESTPQDTWVRMEIPLVQPITDDTEIIRVVLACPNGGVYWDRVSLTLDEATRFYETDQATIISDLVEHLQDEDYDKNDANIVAECPETGVERDRIYYHSEHPNGFRSIEEFTTLDDGVDISMDYTPTTRTLRTHYPRRGRHLPEYALELGRNIADFSWTFQGEEAASSVIVLGSGNGSDREEASAIDSSNFAGGLTLEEVFVAPPDTKIDSLANIAAERLFVTSSPYIVAVKTIPAFGDQKDPVGILQVGDTVPLKIEYGALSINDTYRVIRMSIGPDDELELVLNLRVAVET